MRALIASHWFRHPRVWFTAGALGFVLAIATWLNSREPGTVVPHVWQAPDTPAGDAVRVDIPVVRHVSRRCSIITSRRIVDSTHSEETIIDQQLTTAASVDKREMETPGRLVLTLRISPKTPPGQTQIVTDNAYRCLWNPSSWLVPIEDRWTVYFVTLPPKDASP